MKSKITAFLLFTSILFLSSKVFAQTPEDLLKEYGWTAVYQQEFKTTIPKKFVHEPGEYPVSLYWSLNSVLSKKIGLNLNKYKGKEVLVKVYRLKENLPAECLPFTNGYGMIVFYNDKIVGAWVASLNSACSLDRKYFNFKEVSGKEWGSWLVKSKSVKVKNKLDKELAMLAPAQIVEKMFDSINNKDYKSAMACFTRRYGMNLFFYDLTRDGSIKDDFSSIFIGDKDRLEKIDILDIKELATDNKAIMVFDVQSKVKYKNTDPIDTRWILILKKEIPRIGWRIADIRK